MYKQFMPALSIAGLLWALPACTTITTFPQTENPEIATLEDFNNLTAAVNDHKDKTIKIAGKSIRVEENEDGLLVIAEWLPYPSDDLHFSDEPKSQPTTSKKTGGHRFTFLYPGAKNVDPSLTWRGNKFILLADVKGEKMTPTSLTGRSAQVPYLVAHCVRVWKTGGSQVPHAPDTEFTAYPPLARTYCVD